MKFVIAFVLTLISPLSLGASELMTPSEFERFVEGKTLHFSLNGKPYGAEQFFAGRQTTWQFTGDACVKGIWFPQGAQICFFYEGADQRQCWLFLQKDGKYFARSVNGADGLVLEMTEESDKPLQCPGPDVGV